MGLLLVACGYIHSSIRASAVCGFAPAICCMHRYAASIEPIKAGRKLILHRFASYELGTLLAGECAGIILMLAP